MFFSTCTYDVETPNTCFTEDVLPIFVTKCANPTCHDAATARAGYNLTTYEGILRGVKAKHPSQSVIVSQMRFNQMPPQGYPEISKLELSIIKSWIRHGAPNSSNCTSCDSTYTYNARVKPLLSKWCTSCHQASTAQAGVKLDSYNETKTVALNGKLMGSLNHLGGFTAMPPSSKLSDCDLIALQRWIDAGALEN